MIAAHKDILQISGLFSALSPYNDFDRNTTKPATCLIGYNAQFCFETEIPCKSVKLCLWTLSLPMQMFWQEIWISALFPTPLMIILSVKFEGGLLGQRKMTTFLGDLTEVLDSHCVSSALCGADEFLCVSQSQIERLHCFSEAFFILNHRMCWWQSKFKLWWSSAAEFKEYMENTANTALKASLPFLLLVFQQLASAPFHCPKMVHTFSAFDSAVTFLVWVQHF